MEEAWVTHLPWESHLVTDQEHPQGTIKFGGLFVTVASVAITFINTEVLTWDWPFFIILPLLFLPLQPLMSNWDYYFFFGISCRFLHNCMQNAVCSCIFSEEEVHTLWAFHMGLGAPQTITKSCSKKFTFNVIFLIESGLNSPYDLSLSIYG